MSTRYVALFLTQEPGTHRDYLRIPSPIVGKDLYLRTTDVTFHDDPHSAAEADERPNETFLNTVRLD